MEEYKSNSYKSKAERQQGESGSKKVQGVIVGPANRKKRSDVKKFINAFVQEDITDIKAYILMDVLVPAVKKVLSDTVDTILYGESNRSHRNSNSSRINYRGCYERENDRRDRPVNRNRNSFDYDDIIFNSRGDAEAVLDAMNDIIGQYGIVSVADLYDLANLDHPPYTMNNYGWSNIAGARADRVRDGYILRLPKAIPID